MKKIIVPATLCSLLTLNSLPTLAENTMPQGLDVGMAWDQGLSAVLEFDDQYRFTLGNEGGAFDFLMKKGSFDANTPLTWYVGLGGWVNWDDDEFGPRVPLGVDWSIGQGWNVYGQVQPELDLDSSPELQIGAALGVTYSF